MPWCPKCHTEYVEGFNICTDCHVSLVDDHPALPEQDLPSRDLGEPTLLLTVPDSLQADMLLALLAEQQIPTFKKSRGAGGYFNIYMGLTSLGVEIYVPKQLLGQAREIAELLQQPGCEEEIQIVQEDLPAEEVPDDEKVPFMQDMRV